MVKEVHWDKIAVYHYVTRRWGCGPRCFGIGTGRRAPPIAFSTSRLSFPRPSSRPAVARFMALPFAPGNAGGTNAVLLGHVPASCLVLTHHT